MPTQVIMPQLGESVDEGTISKWLVAEGDPVKELDPLLEVNTDKVDTEIPSPASGTLLKILVPEGDIAQAGMVLAIVGEPDESPESAVAPSGEAAPPVEIEMQTEIQPAGTEPSPAPAASKETPSSPGRHPELGFISPVVAKLAGEFNLDLQKIRGTGAGGRITKKDVLNYIEQRPPEAPSTQPAAAVQPRQPEIQPAPRITPAPQPASSIPVPGEILPHSSIRRSIAEHMLTSKRTSPHVTTVMEVDLHQVTAHREANKSAFARDGVKLTFTAYFVAACASALKTFPVVNSSWSDDGLLLHSEVNIGMATSLGDAGLIVPVIKNADNLSLLGTARAVNDLAERARARQLKPDEVKGGTFTITNHGTSGSLFATPIINQPQCGILGVGVIQKRVTVINDAIAIRPMVYVSLTFDHRILDGASADHFLGKVVELLQNWG